jgi:hypothetical protein
LILLACAILLHLSAKCKFNCCNYWSDVDLATNGPIIGAGFGLAFWLQLIKRSLKPSSSYASGINCFGYLLYLVPLRKCLRIALWTEPNIYDILLAFFKDLLRYCYYSGWKGNPIPVSLLLRLWCATVHRWWYGLAIGSMKFFFELYICNSINCVLYVFLHFIVTF